MIKFMFETLPRISMSQSAHYKTQSSMWDNPTTTAKAWRKGRELLNRVDATVKPKRKPALKKEPKYMKLLKELLA